MFAFHELLLPTLFHSQRPETQTPEKVATLTGNSMGILYAHKLLLQLCLLLALNFSFPLLISSAYTLPDKYFVVCGGSSNITNGSRVFVGDRDFSAGKGKAVKSSDSSGTLTLYQTARVYTKTSSYKFKIDKNGTYIVRLHFSVFSSYPELSDARFNVWASGFLLLTNYSIPNITTPQIEEFFLPIPEGDFKIFFIPSHGSPSAFVNAIEVFLAPDILIPNTTSLINSTGQNVPSSGLNSRVIHTKHRINVGGDYIYGDNLGRNWKPDDPYLFQSSTASSTSPSTPNYDQSEGEYIAPVNVYRTVKYLNANGGSNSSASNVTWSFPVSRNAKHFVRLHFCDIISTSPADLWFNFYINRNFSETIKPYNFSQQLASPFHLDFVVDSDDSGFINVTIGTKDDSRVKDAFLNGLEIMEFMKNSSFIPEESESESNKNLSPVIIGSVSSGALVILVMVVVMGLKFTKQEPDQRLRALLYGGFSSNNKWTKSSANSAQNLNLSLKMSFSDIRYATENFKFLIGEGGFGKVYKGTLGNGLKVAVKRSEPGHGQGIGEFRTEILVFSQIRNRHLVSLIGYCDEGSEMILVYEFMENGPLRDHLYQTKYSSEGSSKPKLSWKQRLEICIGAAKGLDYLHTQAGRIIHRDVKSTNILLDENYVAKVADFGLSKSAPLDDNCTANVKGSVGYMDPDFLKTSQLTEKSDVYSFGVVLFEVLCARPALDESLPVEEANLAEWVMQQLREGQLEKFIDPVLAGDIKPSSLRKFVEIAEKCLKEKGTERPSMQEVVYDLNYALELQEPAAYGEAHEYSKTETVFGLPLPASWDSSIQENDYVTVRGDDDVSISIA